MTAGAPSRHLPYILVYPNLKDHSGDDAKHGSSATTHQQITGQQREQVLQYIRQYMGSVELAFERASKQLPATDNASATAPAAMAMAGASVT